MVCIITENSTLQRPPSRGNLGRRCSTTLLTACLTTTTTFLATQPLLPAQAYLCDYLSDNTWDGLREILESPHHGGFVMLCPFEISGDGCVAAAGDDTTNTAGFVIPSSTNLYIMCEAYYAAVGPQVSHDYYYGGVGETGCIIDCPGTHFDVKTNSTLSLDSFTFRGSNTSSIQVQSNGSLNVFNSYFEGNQNLASNGGAIQAALDSDVYVSQTSFHTNVASSGGAIYSLGQTDIHSSTFFGNVATSREIDMGGGAIFSGPSSALLLTSSDFIQNTAVSFGPAILDLSDGNYSTSDNSGCNNTAESYGVACNGALQVLDYGVDVCAPFQKVCGLASSSTAFDSTTETESSQAPTPTKGSTLLGDAFFPTHRSSSDHPTFSPTIYPTAPPPPQPQEILQPSTAASQLPVVISPPVEMPTIENHGMLPGQHPAQTPEEVPPGNDATSLQWPSYGPSNLTMTPTGLVQGTANPTAIILNDVEVLAAADNQGASSVSTASPTSSQSDVEPNFPSTLSPSVDLAREDELMITRPTTFANSESGSVAPSPVYNPSLTSILPTDAPNSSVPEASISSPLPGEDDAQWLPIQEVTPMPTVQTNNEAASNQQDVCLPLNGFEPLLSDKSYLHGSLKNAPFDMSGLKSCGTEIQAGNRGKLYYLVGSGAVLTAHTCSFFESFNADTQLTVYMAEGNQIPCRQDLECVVANDDFCGEQSLVSWLAEEGQVYFIFVQGKGFEHSATFGLEHQYALTLAPTPGGSCGAAISVYPDATTGVLQFHEDSAGKGLIDLSGFVWYTVGETEFSWLAASTCTSNQTDLIQMTVYHGSCHTGTLQHVEAIERTGCVSGQSLTWPSQAGERYYVKVYRVDLDNQQS